MKQICKGVLPAVVLASAVTAQDLQTIKLPAPDTTGGRPLMQALRDRHSTREFAADTLTTSQLSNLLWAAGGVNRPDEGRRTAPSAMNSQEIDIYVVLANGAYRYDPRAHALEPITAGDFREQTGTQPFVVEAPVNLVFVADFARMGEPAVNDNEQRRREQWAAADAAFMSQNVYLYCASEKLATVVRGSVDHEALVKPLRLSADQRVVLAQTVGRKRG